MRAIFTTLFAITAFGIMQAQTHWKVNTSSINFKIKNAGLTVEGCFTGLVADIKFDSAHYLKSSMEASVDVGTISTGIAMRNNHLKKEEYFDATKYPKISVKSVSFVKERNGTYKGSFKLTIKGTTKDVLIPFSYSEAGNTAVFKSTFILNRRDYSVGGSSWTMSDEANITIVINAQKGN